MDIHRECVEQYGSIYRETFVPGIEFVHISDPKDIEEVFRSDSQHPIRQAFFMLSHYNKKYNENVQGLLTRYLLNLFTIFPRVYFYTVLKINKPVVLGSVLSHLTANNLIIFVL